MPEPLMKTWWDLHPDWEVLVWPCSQLQVVWRRSRFGWVKECQPTAGWKNQSQIDACFSWAAKADIIRYEILYRYGGIFVDADSECVRALDERFLLPEVWCCYENEAYAGKRLANGYLGSVPGSSLMKDLVEACAEVQPQEVTDLLTRIAKGHPELDIFQARTMMPLHYSGTLAPGSATVFAVQHWHGTVGVRRDSNGRMLGNERWI